MDSLETLSFKEAMRHHLLLILVIQGAFLIHTIRSWPVEDGSREERISTYTNIVHKKYVFRTNKLKNVLRRLFLENNEAYIEKTRDDVSIKIRSDTFHHFIKETDLGLKEKYTLEPDLEVEKDDVSISNNLAQNLEMKWFNRIN